jgi:hypothetical protein
MRPKSLLSGRPPGALPAVVPAAVVIVGLCAAFSANPAAQTASAMKGKAETYYYFVFADAVEGQEAEFNRWYDNQHAPDVVAVPGFVTAQRYVVADAQLRSMPPPSKYLVVYKVVTDDLASVTAEVSRRLQTKMTVISPTFKGAANSPGGYYRVISPVIEHKGGPAPKGDTYYQFVFSNPVEGQEAEFNRWYEKQHVPDVVSTPGFVSGLRGELTNPRERREQTTYHYLAMFQIVSNNLPSVFDAFHQLSPKMAGSPAFGKNVGYTYKTLGPLHYGDQVRKERAKSTK